MAKHGWRWPESSPLSCIVSGVRESRSAGRSTQEPLDSIVRKIHPSKIADVMVARRARVRVAASVGLERRHCMPARCGHCSTCASDQMLRRIIPTAERTVTRGGDKKPLTKETPTSAQIIDIKAAFARQYDLDLDGIQRDAKTFRLLVADTSTDSWVNSGQITSNCYTYDGTQALVPDLETTAFSEISPDARVHPRRVELTLDEAIKYS